MCACVLPALTLLVVVVVQVATVAEAISFTVDVLEADLRSRFGFWKGDRDGEETRRKRRRRNRKVEET